MASVKRSRYRVNASMCHYETHNQISYYRYRYRVLVLARCDHTIKHLLPQYLRTLEH